MIDALKCKVCGKPIDHTSCGLPLCDTCPTPPVMLGRQQAWLTVLDIRRDDHIGRRG